MLPLDHRNVVLALQVEPELRAVAEVTAQADGRIGGDRPPAIQNVGDTSGRHADVERKPIGAQFARIQLALQQTARMDGRRHSSHPLW
jgi:hypothetical protein